MVGLEPVAGRAMGQRLPGRDDGQRERVGRARIRAGDRGVAAAWQTTGRPGLGEASQALSGGMADARQECAGGGFASETDPVG